MDSLNLNNSREDIEGLEVAGELGSMNDNSGIKSSNNENRSSLASLSGFSKDLSSKLKEKRFTSESSGDLVVMDDWDIELFNSELIPPPATVRECAALNNDHIR